MKERSTATQSSKPGAFAAWMALIRPKTLGVACAPVVAATSLAYAESHQFDATVFLLTLTLAILMQTITNMQNDIGYTDRKAEIGNRSGPPRATANGWLSMREARLGLLVAVALALFNTVPLIIYGGYAYAAIGISSIVAAYCYMGGPKPIAYTPFGEFAVLIFFGLIATLGTYYLQTHSFSTSAWILGTSLGCLAASVLAVNNFKDREHDASVNRQTLGVLLSPCTFYILIRTLLTFPFIGAIALAIALEGWWFLLLAATAPKALKIARALKSTPPKMLSPVMFQCVVLELEYCLIFSAASLLSCIL